MPKGRPRVEHPRDKMSPESRGYKRLYLTKEQKEQLDAAAQTEGFVTTGDYVMQCHREHQERKKKEG